MSLATTFIDGTKESEPIGLHFLAVALAERGWIAMTGSGACCGQAERHLLADAACCTVTMQLFLKRTGTSL